MPSKLRPKHPQLGDRLYRAAEPHPHVFSVSRFRCIEVREDGSSRWKQEATAITGNHDDEAEASRAADNLNRAEPWYDTSLETP